MLRITATCVTLVLIFLFYTERKVLREAMLEQHRCIEIITKEEFMSKKVVYNKHCNAVFFCKLD